MKEFQEPVQGRQRQDPLTPFQALLIYFSTGIGAFVSTGGAVWYHQGFLLGLVAMIFTFFISILSGWSYTRVWFLTGAYTLQDAYLVTFGRKSQALLNFFNFLISLFYSIGCLYVAATCLNGFFVQVSDNTKSIWLSESMCVVYISFLVLPFTFKKQVKAVSFTATILLFSIVAFTIVSIIFYVKYHLQIEEDHPGLRIPLLPEYSFSTVFIKFLYLLNCTTFTWGTLAVIHAQKPTQPKQAFLPMLYAMAYVTLLFGIISITSMATFKQLLLNHDTILKAFYVYSHSFLALLAQIIFCFIAAFHAPIFLFSSRESLLIFLSQTCKLRQSRSSLQSLNQDEMQQLVQTNEQIERFRIMYERVPAWVFYTSAGCICGVIVLLTIFLKNVQTYFELVLLPYTICLGPVLGNLLLVKINGVKKEKFATFCVICGGILVLLAFVFAIVDLVQ